MAEFDVIREPGKFEGELSIVPEMWDVVMEGFSHDVFVDDTEYSFVTLMAIDQQPTEDLYGACMWERSDGFVMTEWYSTEAEYDAAIAKYEKAAEESEEETDNYE